MELEFYLEIETPHEGEEKFEKDDEEEIDINDKTGEGLFLLLKRNSLV